MENESFGDAWYSCARNSGWEFVFRATDSAYALVALVPNQYDGNLGTGHVHDEHWKNGYGIRLVRPNVSGRMR